jgi:hypothetical protein
VCLSDAKVKAKGATWPFSHAFWKPSIAAFTSIRCCWGGDPLAIVETAGKQLRKRAGRGEPYVTRVVLLDADRGGLTPERTAQAVRLAANLDLRLVWQEPCHEAFLL